jgi:acyl phosphate:glycerol-3-phosphate acyltransferase
MIIDVLTGLDWAAAGPYLAGAAIGGYLLGSIPFGLIFTRLFGMGDVRKIGSGNIGATNVLRTGNKTAALLTLLFDAGKAALAAFIAGGAWWLWFGDTQPWGGAAMMAIAALFAFFGHIFPVWLGFKGGKGVATFFGTVLMLFWPVGLIAGATWLVTAAALRISSLSALVAAALTPLYFWAFGKSMFAIVCVLFALMIFWSHRDNIRRLLNGQEPKIGAKKAAA